MIEFDETMFPNNVVQYTSQAMQSIDADIKVFKRPLRNTDPMQSIGVFAEAWDPDPESYEMQGIDFPSPNQPTLQQYRLGVQAFIKDSEQERGLAVHAALSQRVRSVLYTNPNLQIVFGQLSVDLPGGMTESMRRWGVRTARYFSGEIDAQMLYLSTLEFWIETETRLANN